MTSLVTRPTDTQMNVNIPYRDMMLPLQGPENPFGDRNRFINQNALAGHVEEQSISEHAFRAQHLTHSILGYSANPSVDPNAPAIIGSMENAKANNFQTIDTLRISRSERKKLKRKRENKGDLEIVDGEGAYVGPWASWKGEDNQVDFLAGVSVGDEEEEEEEEELDYTIKKAKPKKGAIGQESSVFHGTSLTDYQGRTYMSAPIADAPQLSQEAGSQDCFIPKVCIYTWTGHTQGVSVIRTLPETGHLFISGSMDTKIKVRVLLCLCIVRTLIICFLQLWDIYTHSNCLRTFHGHVKAVKDICFSNDGRRFLSCGYDRQMKLWDTETGQCLQRFSNGKIPYVVRFHPDEDKQNIFLAGMSDKKIIQVGFPQGSPKWFLMLAFSQYDINTGEIIQEYDQHLGPVNTITFVDENRRFVTTSDDKTIRAWDFDIPVVIKYIAEPHMHSMPSVTLHPSSMSRAPCALPAI